MASPFPSCTFFSFPSKSKPGKTKPHLCLFSLAIGCWHLCLPIKINWGQGLSHADSFRGTQINIRIQATLGQTHCISPYPSLPLSISGPWIALLHITDICNHCHFPGITRAPVAPLNLQPFFSSSSASSPRPSLILPLLPHRVDSGGAQAILPLPLITMLISQSKMEDQMGETKTKPSRSQRLSTWQGKVKVSRLEAGTVSVVCRQSPPQSPSLASP